MPTTLWTLLVKSMLALGVGSGDPLWDTARATRRRGTASDWLRRPAPADQTVPPAVTYWAPNLGSAKDRRAVSRVGHGVGPVKVQASDGRHFTCANGCSKSDDISASQRRPKAPSVNCSLPTPSSPAPKTNGRMSLNAHIGHVRVEPKPQRRRPLAGLEFAGWRAAKDTRRLSNKRAMKGCVATLVNTVSPPCTARSRVTYSCRAILPIAAERKRGLDVRPLVDRLVV